MSKQDSELVIKAISTENQRNREEKETSVTWKLDQG